MNEYKVLCYIILTADIYRRISPINVLPEEPSLIGMRQVNFINILWAKR